MEKKLLDNLEVKIYKTLGGRVTCTQCNALSKLSRYMSNHTENMDDIAAISIIEKL